mgnify:CR=1 FL=1
MKKCVRLQAALAAALVALPLGGCAPRQETGELRTIDVCEVTHSVFYAPQYVAMSQGFFAEEGLSVELTVGQGADKVMAAVLSGSVDIGLAGPEASIYVMEEGRQDYPQVFAQLTQRDGSFLVGREPKEDFQWEDLRGSHLLPGRKGGVPYMTLEYVLQEHGLVPGEDLLFDDSVDFSMMAAAFAAGTGDYVTIFEPTASAMELQGQGHILASVGQAGGEIPFTAYFAAGSRLAEEPELFEGFTRAVYRGQKWVEEHSPEEVAEVLQPYFADTDPAVMISVVENYKAIDAWAHTPVMSRPGFEKLQDIMQQAGQLKERVSYDDLVENRFAEAVTAE